MAGEDNSYKLNNCSCIYRIVSPKNKIYIGQTRNWFSRRSKYKNLKCEEQLYIFRSLKKYGYESHNISILERFDKNIEQTFLNEKEVYWWQYYKDLGYEMLNIRYPGTTGKMSQEMVEKCRVRNSGENNPCFGKFGKEHPAFGNRGHWKNCRKEDHPMYGRTGKLSPNFGRTGEKHPMFGLRAGKSPFAKKVIDNKTGIVYTSAKDASSELKINYSYLTQYLRKRANGIEFISKYDLNYIL